MIEPLLAILSSPDEREKLGKNGRKLYLSNYQFQDKKGDLKICCLLKAGFSQKEIMELLDLKEEAMYKRMQRLKSRLSLKKKWSKNELEQYISSF